MREQARSEKASIDDNSSGGEIERKYNRDELLKMDIAELEKLIPKA